jgi:uncharacterized protein YkwD
MKAVMLGIAVAAALAAGPGLACSVPGGEGGIAAGIVDWVNAQRAAKGLSRLAPNGKLEAAARVHACDMADAGVMAHVVPGGPSFQSRIKGSGYRMRTAVENIAKSSRSGADVAAGIWAKSAGHMANVLNPALREIGVAVATDGSSLYYVMVGGAGR